MVPGVIRDRIELPLEAVEIARFVAFEPGLERKTAVTCEEAYGVVAQPFVRIPFTIIPRAGLLRIQMLVIALIVPVQPQIPCADRRLQVGAAREVLVGTRSEQHAVTVPFGGFRDDVDGRVKRARAVQRRTWAAQHLDLVDHLQGKVHKEVAAPGDLVVNGHAVEHDLDLVGEVGVGVFETANRRHRITHGTDLDLEPRQHRQRFGKIPDPRVAEPVRIDHRDDRRKVVHVERTLRGDVAGVFEQRRDLFRRVGCAQQRCQCREQQYRYGQISLHVVSVGADIVNGVIIMKKTTFRMSTLIP